MITIAVGSVEYLACKVTDVLPSPDAMTTLVGKNAKYSTYTPDEVVCENNLTATIASGDPLIALCLIHALLPGTYPQEDEYSLFLTFQNGAETPRLGPFKFRIDD